MGGKGAPVTLAGSHFGLKVLGMPFLAEEIYGGRLAKSYSGFEHIFWE
jgi:hypothetical protein